MRFLARSVSSAASYCRSPWHVILPLRCTLHDHRRQCHAAPINQAFVAFALFGKGHAGAGVKAARVRMDGKAFAKLLKEAGCMGRGLDATRVDLCFAKACDKVCKALHSCRSEPTC